GVYAQSKLDAEHALFSLRRRGFSVIALRKGSLYGFSPSMRWDLIINRVALNGWLGRPLTLHEFGAVWRPIAHVQDAARAYLHLLDVPPATLDGLTATNGTGASPPILNLVERNARLSEMFLEIDAVLHRKLGRGIDLQHGSSALPQRTGRISGESLRAIGWRPERSLHDGVTELIARLDAQEVPFPEEVLV
ncbi:MAG: NAD-dependent epimerase/dehydratase family protein, partial [bacterium]